MAKTKKATMGCMVLFGYIFGRFKGYVCVAVICDIQNPDRTKQGFNQAFYLWPDQLREIKAWIGEHRGSNCYFSPILFSAPQRKKEFALAGHTLWADLDECRPTYLGKYGEPEPSIIVQTSPNRHQAYWLLKLDIEPGEYEEINHRIALAYADLGCDKGGWDLTQLLRIPGTTHSKAEPFVVQARLLRRGSQLYYQPKQFNALPSVTKITSTATVEFSQLPQVDVAELKVSNRLKGLIVRGWHEGCGYKSRSE